MKLISKRFLIAILALGSCISSQAQQEFSYQQEGEFGFSVGAGHYFGDLNTRMKLNRPKMAAGVFFRKNFGNYVAARLGVNYARLGYSDIYNTHNPVQQQRNLSFNTNIWEATLQGDFNFFRFLPGEPGYNFTPYITLGVGAFNYDPYGYYNNEKIFLRPLGTEGQGFLPDKKQYGAIAMSIPMGVGLKYAINERLNVGVEVLHRLTTTDYIDDVSTVYVDPTIFPAHPTGGPSINQIMADRSAEIGTPIGIAGRQRGNSKQKDQFVTAMFFLSFNIQTYKCPTSN